MLKLKENTMRRLRGRGRPCQCCDTSPCLKREAARAASQPTYDTGIPCVNGHTVQRLTSTGQCRECVADQGRRYKKKHPDKVKEDSARYWKRKGTPRPAYGKYYLKDSEKLRRAGVCETEIELIEEMYWFYRDCCSELLGVKCEVDHRVPRSRGGPHRLWNLQILTKKANRAKGAKLNWKP